MVPRILYLHPKTYKRLIRLRKQAERDGAYRVAKRLQAVVLNSEGRTSGELAHLLGSPRSRVSEWLARYQAFGVEGLLEGHRSGRPLELTSAQRKQLDDILERDRKSTRLNSSHGYISYAVFCLKKKKRTKTSVHDSP